MTIWKYCKKTTKYAYANAILVYCLPQLVQYSVHKQHILVHIFYHKNNITEIID